MKQKDFYSIASTFAFEAIFIIGISLFLGIVLDNWLNTKVVFKLLFIIAGTFTTIYNLIRKVKRLEDKDEK